MKFGTSRKPQTLSFGPGGCIDSFHKLKKANIFFFWGGRLVFLGRENLMKSHGISDFFFVVHFVGSVAVVVFLFENWYHIICYVLLIMSRLLMGIFDLVKSLLDVGSCLSSWSDGKPYRIGCSGLMGQVSRSGQSKLMSEWVRMGLSRLSSNGISTQKSRIGWKFELWRNWKFWTFPSKQNQFGWEHFQNFLLILRLLVDSQPRCC